MNGESPAANSITVLVVDDEPSNLTSIEKIFQRDGMTVLTAHNAREALDILRVHPVDVVLTDVYLKGELTGKDLVKSIRNDFGYPKGQLPVLVMTGDANPANQTELLRSGANDLVLKPIEERLLITKLLFQLRVGRLLRERHGH